MDKVMTVIVKPHAHFRDLVGAGEIRLDMAPREHEERRESGKRGEPATLPGSAPGADALTESPLFGRSPAGALPAQAGRGREHGEPADGCCVGVRDVLELLTQRYPGLKRYLLLDDDGAFRSNAIVISGNGGLLSLRDRVTDGEVIHLMPAPIGG
ncbi:MAG: MoaD/ThiS family protein [Firmicutes bacterium]|nr:MoaD/ThiS family protein [Bacillota bacterium]